jgi:predicted AlkP superfamily pyrophosphatase or phosphodiesterase
MLTLPEGLVAHRVLRACAAIALAAAVSFTSPARASHRMLVVSVDGLRPDVAMRADMPALRTFYCATTDTAVTLPSHFSMFTGVPPEKHGITYNADPKPGEAVAPRWPTLFALAHRAGMTTGMSAGKSKFSALVDTLNLDWNFVPPAGTHSVDSLVASAAVEIIRKHRPQLLFVHLPSVDVTGHAKGWGSPEQLTEASGADRALGRVLRALQKAGVMDSTRIIVSADHGGAALGHGGIDARSHFIPWVLAGPGVRANYDLTRVPGLRVRTEDTFATSAAWLGLEIKKPVDGRAVTEAEALPDTSAR